MILTEKIKQLMQQIKELEPEYEIITEEEIKKELKNTQKRRSKF